MDLLNIAKHYFEQDVAGLCQKFVLNWVFRRWRQFRGIGDVRETLDVRGFFRWQYRRRPNAEGKGALCDWFVRPAG